MEEQARADDEFVVCAVTTSIPRWLGILYSTQLGLAVLQVALRPDAFHWALVAFWVVGVVGFIVVRRRERRRPAELVLGSWGLVFRPALGRERRYAWEDVERLDVDPPGGPRAVNLTLQNGAFRRLLTVGEDDVPAVRARWQQVTEQRTARRP